MDSTLPVRRRAALTLAALVALGACDALPTHTPSGPDQQLSRRVEAMGFRGDMVVDMGDYVVVEGDIRIPKSQLATARPASSDPMGPQFQYRTYALVGSPKVHNIVVDLSGLSSQTAWQTAARDAMQQWNDVADSYVRFVEGSPADISVGTDCSLGSSVAAQASWPSGGNPGPTIHVNPCFAWSLNHAQRVHNMVHEFGHTIGFRHTNWQSRGESAGTAGAVHITYTPTGNDAGSVMNGGTALSSWAGFSYYDRVATVRLYPLPAPTSVSISYPGGTPTMSWAPVSGASYYRIRLYVYSSWYSPEYGSTWTHSYTDVGTTAGTTFADASRTYTGTGSCYFYYPDANEEEYRDYWYSVEAVFPNGWAGTIIGAAVATC